MPDKGTSTIMFFFVCGVGTALWIVVIVTLVLGAKAEYYVLEVIVALVLMYLLARFG